jgi:hypothetical protein
VRKLRPLDYLEFIYTKAFVASVKGVLTQEELRRVEATLVDDPRAGVVERGTGGVRKIRVGLPGRGKSGGARVVYYYREARGRIYLLLAYPKTEKASLTKAEKNELAKLTRALEGEP